MQKRIVKYKGKIPKNISSVTLTHQHYATWVTIDVNKKGFICHFIIFLPIDVAPLNRFIDRKYRTNKEYQDVIKYFLDNEKEYINKSFKEKTICKK